MLRRSLTTFISGKNVKTIRNIDSISLLFSGLNFVDVIQLTPPIVSDIVDKRNTRRLGQSGLRVITGQQIRISHSDGSVLDRLKTTTSSQTQLTTLGKVHERWMGDNGEARRDTRRVDYALLGSR